MTALIRDAAPVETASCSRAPIAAAYLAKEPCFMEVSLLRRLAQLSLSAALSLAGCAASKANLPPVRQLPADAAALLPNAPDTYAPESLRLQGIDGDESLRAAQAFDRGLSKDIRTNVRHDPALDLVAALVAETVNTDERLPATSLTQWLFWKSGGTSTYSGTITALASGPGAREFLDQSSSKSARGLTAEPIPRSYGAARTLHGQVWTQVIVLGRSPLAVSRIKKRYAPGETLTLSGRPHDAFSDLAFYIDTGPNEVHEEPLTAGADGSVSVSYPVPTRPGRYFIEITGVEPKQKAADPDNPWRVRLLWLPIYVGIPEPSTPDEFIAKPAPNPPDPATWRAHILAAYNAERARFGRPPLSSNPRVDALAQQRSEQAAAANRELPPDPNLADKLVAAGLRVREYRQSSTRFDFISEYEHLQLLRPSVRAALLDPDTWILGLGLTPRPDAEHVGVEYLVSPLHPFDSSKDRARVLGDLDAVAIAAGQPPYQRAEAFSPLVQQLAEEVCRGQRKPGDLDALWERAKEQKLSFQRGSMSHWSGYDLSRPQLEKLHASMKEPGMTHLALGLCQGDLPGRPGVIYAVAVWVKP